MNQDVDFSLLLSRILPRLSDRSWLRCEIITLLAYKVHFTQYFIPTVALDPSQIEFAKLLVAAQT